MAESIVSKLLDDSEATEPNDSAAEEAAEPADDLDAQADLMDARDLLAAFEARDEEAVAAVLRSIRTR